MTPARATIALWLLTFAVFGCAAPQYALSGSAQVPGTFGAVQLEKADGGKLLVTVVLDELSPPSHLADALTSYVLWFQVDGAEPVNQGVLTYDQAKRRATATAVTEHRSFDLMVTAESTAEASEPSDFVVAKQQIREG